MRHIETVRNYIGAVINQLMDRQEKHDQSKLQEPELSVFNKYTPMLRGMTYGSEEYKRIMKEMKVAIDHHAQVNRHHPEHFIGINVCIICFREYPLDNTPNRCETCRNGTFTEEKVGINGMTLLDLIEMICDWKAATLRHGDGDIYKSLEINAERFKYSGQLKQILKNTIDELNSMHIEHYAEES
jgi:hypothetical protein